MLQETLSTSYWRMESDPCNRRHSCIVMPENGGYSIDNGHCLKTEPVFTLPSPNHFDSTVAVLRHFVAITLFEILRKRLHLLIDRLALPTMASIGELEGQVSIAA